MALLALASLAIPDLARPGAPPHLAALYQAIGAQRSMAGLQPLAPSPDLELLAAAWSQHIAAKGKLIHRDDLRHIMLERGWWALTENLHFSSRPFDPADVMSHWMASRPHRANLLDPNVTHIGLGTAVGPEGHTFTVFNAARLTPPAPDPKGEPVGGLIAPPGARKPSPVPRR
ncbi:MAG: CAP domain-containing protein [Verrucomicrobiae bacterium]|nr:CAP domain-containing protein [Verrucomicrobiae bacterium]